MTEAPDEAAFPAPATAWSVVLLLLLAYIVAVMDRQILSLLVQPIRHDLGITDTQLSLLQGFAFAITFTVLGVFFGRVADRGNRRNLIVIGMLTWCFATVACGFARNFTELFVARMLVGVGEAALSPAAYSLIADYFHPGRRGRAMGVYTLGTFVGSGVAMIAGALAILSTMGAAQVQLPLIGMMPNWKAAFVIVGLPGIFVAGAMLLVREPVRRERAAAGTTSSTLGFVRENFAILAAVICGLSLNALASFSLISWTPTIFIRLFGWQASAIGAAYGAILAVAGGLGILFSGWLADRMASRGGARPLVLASWAIAAVVPVSMWVGLAPSPGRGARGALGLQLPAGNADGACAARDLSAHAQRASRSDDRGISTGSHIGRPRPRPDGGGGDQCEPVRE
jgi:predicted MFS family arabinose efflux permease